MPLGAGPEIWPTNNFGECDLRPSKTQQKISGRLTSEDITQDCLDIRSYIDTIRKHKATSSPPPLATTDRRTNLTTTPSQLTPPA